MSLTFRVYLLLTISFAFVVLLCNCDKAKSSSENPHTRQTGPQPQPQPTQKTEEIDPKLKPKRFKDRNGEWRDDCYPAEHPLVDAYQKYGIAMIWNQELNCFHTEHAYKPPVKKDPPKEFPWLILFMTIVGAVITVPVLQWATKKKAETTEDEPVTFKVKKI